MPSGERPDDKPFHFGCFVLTSSGSGSRSYPRQRMTGSAGYFGNEGSVRERVHWMKSEPFAHFAYRRRDQLPDLRHSLIKRSAAELRGSGNGIHRVCHVGAEGGGGRLECAPDVSSVTFNVLAQGPQAVVNRLAEGFQSP